MADLRGLYEVTEFSELRKAIDYYTPAMAITGQVEVPKLKLLANEVRREKETTIPSATYNYMTFNCVGGLTLEANSVFHNCTFNVAGPIYLDAQDNSAAGKIEIDNSTFNLKKYEAPQSDDPEVKPLEAIDIYAESFFCLDRLNNIYGAQLYVDKCTFNLAEGCIFIDAPQNLVYNLDPEGVYRLTINDSEVNGIAKANLVRYSGPASIALSGLKVDGSVWATTDDTATEADPWYSMIEIMNDFATGGASLRMTNFTWANKIPKTLVKSHAMGVDNLITDGYASTSIRISYNGKIIPSSKIFYEFTIDDNTYMDMPLEDVLERIGSACTVILPEDAAEAPAEGVPKCLILPHLRLKNSQVRFVGNLAVDTVLDLRSSLVKIEGDLEVGNFILLDDYSSLEVTGSIKIQKEEFTLPENKKHDGDENTVMYGPYDTRTVLVNETIDTPSAGAGAGNPMNNAILQKFFDAFGDRICYLVFDNGSSVSIGYKNHTSSVPSIKDIQLITIDDTDFVVTPASNPHPRDRLMGIGWKCYHPTACLQQIYVMNEGISENYRIDPLTFG